MIHVGRLIEIELHRQGLSVTWFAEQLCCARTNVYKIFGKSSIDTELLLRISDILQYDFFQCYSAYIISFSFIILVLYRLSFSFLSEGIEPIGNICHKIYVRCTGFSVGDRILGNGTFRTFILTKYII